MIVVQTPLRISFFGGATDFEGFYREYGGAVLSSTIDKCVYVIVKRRFDDRIYINYSEKEIVDSVQEIRHNLVRGAMELTGVDRGVEITILSDIPSKGSGLGSSSSIAVALLHALYTYRGQLVTAEKLAEEACLIEITKMKSPIGRQDQYIASYGNMRFIEFSGEGVKVGNVDVESETKRHLTERLLLYHTGVTRSSNDILVEQKANIQENIVALQRLRDLAYAGKEVLEKREFDVFGGYLHKGWMIKKGLASGISSSGIDEIYQSAIGAGAVGGKVLGAGGGGFLLLYCAVEKRADVRSKLSHLREMPFSFGEDGSKVIFDHR